MLEHMMFKGTQNYPKSAFSTIIAENGGEQNAATSFDFTFYYQELENQRLAISFELEADRMQNLHLSEKEFSKENKIDYVKFLVEINLSSENLLPSGKEWIFRFEDTKYGWKVVGFYPLR